MAEPLPPNQIPGPQQADAVQPQQEGGGEGGIQSVVLSLDKGFSLLIDAASSAGSPEDAQELSDIRQQFQAVITRITGGQPAEQAGAVPQQGGAAPQPNAGGGIPAGPAGV